MITEQQRLDRKNHFGSSDIAAMFTDKDGKSLDPHKTLADMLATKIYDMKAGKTTEAQDRGNRHEKAMIEYVEEQYNVKVVTDPNRLHFVCKEHPIFTCNLDGFILPPSKLSHLSPIIVEAKTTSIGDEYGEPETDQVPYRVNLQVQQQMLCTGWNTAYVTTLRAIFGRLDESIYVVNRDERIINAIIERGIRLWNGCVLTKTLPPDSLPGDVELYKRIIRMPNKYAEVDPALILEWEQTKAEKNRLDKLAEKLQAQVLMQLGDAEGASIDSTKELTYFEQSGRDLLNLDLLKTKYPEVYAEIATPNICRVARIRKIK